MIICSICDMYLTELNWTASMKGWLVLIWMVDVSSSSCKVWTFAHHGVKHSDICCFAGVTYVALTMCCKLRSFYIDCNKQRSNRLMIPVMSISVHQHQAVCLWLCSECWYSRLEWSYSYSQPWWEKYSTHWMAWSSVTKRCRPFLWAGVYKSWYSQCMNSQFFH